MLSYNILLHWFLNLSKHMKHLEDFLRQTAESGALQWHPGMCISTNSQLTPMVLISELDCENKRYTGPLPSVKKERLQYVSF